MANIKIEVILKIFFLKFSNNVISVDNKSFIWKSYIINKALVNIKKVNIINPKKFIIAALDVNSKVFIIYIAIWKQEKIIIYLGKKTQIGT